MKRSQTRSMISLATSTFGIASAVRDLRLARQTGDKLALADAVASLAAVVTGLAIAYRALRNPEDDA